LGAFDTISQDGTVTLAEMEHFYEHLSSTIQSDAHFINIVRNAWHLHGATGGHCLRVRITLPQTPGVDFTPQRQLDIRPDLKCSVQDPNFKPLLFKRLAEMGYAEVAEVQIISRT